MKTLLLFFVVAAGVYVADEMSWATEQIGDVTIRKKMSGPAWTQMYEYDGQGRLRSYSWSDSQFRNHTIIYDPETGREIDRY